MLTSRLVSRLARGLRGHMNQTGISAAVGNGVFTFTRTGVAYDLAGKSYAGNVPRFDAGAGYQGAENLCLRSQRFDISTWTKTRASITGNAIAAPDGTTTADFLIEDATAGATHQMTITTPVVVAGLAYAQSVYAKAGGRTRIRFGSSSATASSAFFDLSNGTVDNIGANLAGASISDVGGGWYRCAVYDDAWTGHTTTAIFLVTGTATTSYDGDGASGVYLWGAQIEANGSGPSTYIETETVPAYRAGTVSLTGVLIEPAATNIALRSNAFDNAAWTKVRATVSANPTTRGAPDGTATADRLVEDATAGASHYTHQAVLTGADVAAISVYARAGERSWLLLSTDTSLSDGAYFNLAAGAVGTVTTGTAKISPVGNGWYRCQFSTTSAVTTSMVIATATADATPTHNGSTSNGLYLWGAQAEVGTGSEFGATRYIPTTTASVTRDPEVLSLPTQDWVNNQQGTVIVRFRRDTAGTAGMLVDLNGATAAGIELYIDSSGYVILIVHDGGGFNTLTSTTTIAAGTEYTIAATWRPGGLALAVNGVIEDIRGLNQALRSQTMDHAAWVKAFATVSADAIAAPDGTTTADKLVEDATAASVHAIYQDFNGTGSPYVYSVYAKAAERSKIWMSGDVYAIQCAFFDLTGGTVGTVTGGTATIADAGGGWWRCSLAVTTANRDGLAIGTAINDNDTTHNGDNTKGVYLWGAQAEMGADLTAYTATTTIPAPRGNLWTVPALAGVGCSYLGALPINGAILELHALDRALTRSELCAMTNGQRIPQTADHVLYAPFDGNLTAYVGRPVNVCTGRNRKLYRLPFLV